MICPRCNRVNDRGLVIRGLKFFALVLFVCTVTWVVRVSANFASVPPHERGRFDAALTPTTSDQPDLKF